MGSRIKRRQFLKTAAATGAAVGAFPLYGQGASDRTLRVGVMGVNGRGRALAEGFARLEGAEVGYICDVDSRAVDRAVKAVEDAGGRKPIAVGDFRKILDDRTVDALVIAAPDHWHAPATILACSAGKHVYVEKPCSHNPQEGEWMVEAARKHDRVVQMGNQRRSWEKIVEAVGRLREGVIGRVYYSRGWYANKRGSIGEGKVGPAPKWLDYELWQGPAPRHDFRDNLIHYNWHWFWHWGTGELGNNGVHALDLCRWGLGVDFPIRVTSGGGRYHFRDDQETPDTHAVTFDFPGRRSISWDSLSCNAHGIEGGFGASFHGEGGSLVLTGTGYRIHDLADKEVETVSGPRDDADHYRSFTDCIRKGGRPTADIEGGHKSTLLCHLGNIAQRSGGSLRCDPENGHILNRRAQKYWGREYAKGWEPRV